MSASEMGTVNYSEIEETPASLQAKNFNNTIEQPTTDLGNLVTNTPGAFFAIIILPLITVIAYIALKAVTGNLPFFGG
jgi:hypothetical protein